MEIEKQEIKSNKLDPVYIDIESIFLNTTLESIDKWKEKINAVNKQIVRSTVVTRWALQLKLRRLQDKLQMNQLLYEELKKQYSKK